MVRSLALGLALLCACATVPRRTDGPFDLKITNGRIVDGTGAPWFRGDLAIRGDTIVAVGDLSGQDARTIIDAQGEIVAPGFIDLLGQSQLYVLVDPRLEGKVRQGVTTEVTGEGHSPGPAPEAMLKDRSPEGAPTAFRTLGAYLDAVDARGSAINFALLLGHASVRELVMGEANRDPTPEELSRMRSLVAQGMRDGALGLSTSLVYVPGTYSKTEELVALAEVAAKLGGVYFTHLRNEGAHIAAALDEALQIGREARIPVNVWHLKVAGQENWGRMGEVLTQIEAARARGVDIAANVYPYAAASTGLALLAPSWAMEGGYSELRERLKDPKLRRRIADEIRERGAEGFFAPGSSGEGILVTGLSDKALAHLERRRLSDIAAMLGLDPVDALLRLYELSSRNPDAIYFSMSEEDMKLALRTPWVSVGADSGAVVGEKRSKAVHPRAYGTFPRVVGRFVREERLFRLEEAVRKVTSQAAARAQLTDRGLLRPGLKADVVVFDPDALEDRSTFEEPHRFSVGVTHVIVNGDPVLRDGALTGALPGRTLRGPAFSR